MERYLKLFKEVMEPGDGEVGSKLKRIQEVSDFIKTAFSSKATSQVLLYLVHNGAATSWTLQCDLNLPESTVYRALKRLRSADIIVPALKVSHQRRVQKGGPKPSLWVTSLTSVSETGAALKRHYRLLSPKFRVAEQIAQTILDEFTGDEPREIRYTEIMVIVRSLKLPFVGRSDIADLAARYLQEKKVKVWR